MGRRAGRSSEDTLRVLRSCGIWATVGETGEQRFPLRACTLFPTSLAHAALAGSHLFSRLCLPGVCTVEGCPLAKSGSLKKLALNDVLRRFPIVAWVEGGRDRTGPVSPLRHWLLNHPSIETSEQLLLRQLVRDPLRLFATRSQLFEFRCTLLVIKHASTECRVRDLRTNVEKHEQVWLRLDQIG